jgi:nucleoside-diphosphate-sugar epimerase
MSGKLVLVTGATGYLASHVVVALLDQGYRGEQSLLLRSQTPALVHTVRPYG